MLTNVPNFLTQGALISLLEDLTVGMRGAFDFFYCPWDPYEDKNLGYAIINFFSRSVAADFERTWTNKPLLQGARMKKLRIVPAALQGRAANLRHFSGFGLAHHVDPRFRPLVRAGPNEALRPMSISQELKTHEAPLQTTISGRGGLSPQPCVAQEPNVALSNSFLSPNRQTSAPVQSKTYADNVMELLQKINNPSDPGSDILGYPLLRSPRQRQTSQTEHEASTFTTLQQLAVLNQIAGMNPVSSDVLTVHQCPLMALTENYLQTLQSLAPWERG